MEKTMQVTFALLAVFLAAAQGKSFVLNDPDTSVPCLLLDTDFTVDLAAVRGGKVIAESKISSDDDGIRVSGSCGDISPVINLFFQDGVNWALKFKQDPNGDAYLNRIVQFIPSRVFGEAVPISDYQLMDDPGTTDLGDATNSYECPVTETFNYDPVTVTTNTTNFTAVATVSYFHTQAFNIKDGNFSDAVICEAALPTSTSAPVSETTTQEEQTTPEVETTQAPTTRKPKPPPTSSPKPSTKLYTVKDGNTTCIALQAALTLSIRYPVEGKGKTKTAKLFVPDDATSSGNCELSATSQELTISFFEDWNLKFVFSNTEKNLLDVLTSSTNNEKAKHPKYKISRIELTGSVDTNKFPGTTWAADKALNFTKEKSHFPEIGATKSYYKCNSPLKTKVTSDASVESRNLKVKAFNTDNKADFSGPAAVCAADSSTNKNRTYVIVGCVLAAIVVLCFIVFVVMRVIRKRRENYHTLQ